MVTSDTSILWPIVAGAVIILANAFFVIFEYAIVTVRRADRAPGRGRQSQRRPRLTHVGRS